MVENITVLPYSDKDLPKPKYQMYKIYQLGSFIVQDFTFIKFIKLYLFILVWIIVFLQIETFKGINLLIARNLVFIRVLQYWFSTTSPVQLRASEKATE